MHPVETHKALEALHPIGHMGEISDVINWLHVRDESEKDGPIVVSISNQILSPTSFSALT